jgi:hypothetical protein
MTNSSGRVKRQLETEISERKQLEEALRRSQEEIQQKEMLLEQARQERGVLSGLALIYQVFMNWVVLF